MTTESIALLSLAISGLSLLVALFAACGVWAPFWYDKHKLTARGAAIVSRDGSVQLSITVANVGKRPTVLHHILVEQPGVPGHYLGFAGDKPARLEVGDSISQLLTLASWKTVQDIHACDFLVIDSSNKQHKVGIDGRRTPFKATRSR